MPAGGIFQTEPPGGCLRQALEFGTYCLLLIRERMITYYGGDDANYTTGFGFGFGRIAADSVLVRGDDAHQIPALGLQSLS
eukprot:scaffold128518_cov37-Cyclotella_meneghiniana.AAC.2